MTMASHTFGALISLNGGSPIADPMAVHHKDPHTSISPSNAYKLDELTFGNRPGGHSRITNTNGTQTPTIPNELESSRPASPHNEETVDIVQTLSNPPMNKYRLLSACLMCFGNGLNDSAPGALLPYIEKHYHINYIIVSLIFITNALGFIVAFPLTQPLQAKLGRAHVLLLAQGMMVTAYLMLVFTPPYPAVVLSFFFTGLGMAINLALNNSFCANLANATATLGLFHGSYGVGGTVGPLIATAIVSRGSHIWSTFYFVPLALTIVNALVAYVTFRHYERDNPSANSLNSTSTHSQVRPPSRVGLLTNALKNRTTILGALFIFAYQGAEVSISGWLISYLLSYRKSEPSKAGYITAGFWAGITLGRFLLSHPAHKIGEKISVAALTVGAAVFQILVWQIPNVIGDAVAISIVGFLLGPIYPCATSVISKLVGRRLQISSLAAVSALGSSGGALAPFFTGLLAQQAGTWVLHPVCVSLYVAMVGCWWGLPKISKRRE